MLWTFISATGVLHGMALQKLGVVNRHAEIGVLTTRFNTMLKVDSTKYVELADDKQRLMMQSF